MVVLDMIQDHLTPGKPMEVPRARLIVPAMQRRIEEARAKSIPIIYVCDTHRLDDPDFRDWPVHAVEGTPGISRLHQLLGRRILRQPVQRHEGVRHHRSPGLSAG